MLDRPLQDLVDELAIDDLRRLRAIDLSCPHGLRHKRPIAVLAAIVEPARLLEIEGGDGRGTEPAPCQAIAGPAGPVDEGGRILLRRHVVEHHARVQHDAAARIGQAELPGDRLVPQHPAADQRHIDDGARSEAGENARSDSRSDERDRYRATGHGDAVEEKDGLRQGQRREGEPGKRPAPCPIAAPSPCDGKHAQADQPHRQPVGHRVDPSLVQLQVQEQIAAANDAHRSAVQDHAGDQGHRDAGQHDQRQICPARDAIDPSIAAGAIAQAFRLELGEIGIHRHQHREKECLSRFPPHRGRHRARCRLLGKCRVMDDMIGGVEILRRVARRDGETTAVKAGHQRRQRQQDQENHRRGIASPFPGGQRRLISRRRHARRPLSGRVIGRARARAASWGSIAFSISSAARRSRCSRHRHPAAARWRGPGRGAGRAGRRRLPPRPRRSRR